MIFGFLYLLNCVVLSVFAGHKVKFILSPCPCVGLFVQRHSLQCTSAGLVVRRGRRRGGFVGVSESVTSLEFTVAECEVQVDECQPVQSAILTHL